MRTIDQRLVKPRALAAGHDGLQHFQRRIVRMVGRHARIDHPHRGQGHIGRIGFDPTRGGTGGLDRPFEHRHRAVRVADVAEILIHPAVQLGRIEIAGDDHRRRGGAVVGLVEGAGVLDLRRVQLLDGADHAAAIDALVETVVAQNEALEATVRRRIDPLTQLFLDDRALRVEHRLVDHRPRHPLGVGPQHGLEILRRHRLIVVGEVLAGGGVARAAGVLDHRRDAAVGDVDRLAAQDVFEQMGEAAAALRIVLAADVIPEGHRHRARRGVRHGVDVQPVGQFAMRELQWRHRDRRGRLGEGGRECQRSESQQRGPQKRGGAGHVGGPQSIRSEQVRDPISDPPRP